MTERELRLRERIDRMMDEADILRDRIARLEDRLRGVRTGRCCYCGAPTRARACLVHADLMRHDFWYAA